MTWTLYGMMIDTWYAGRAGMIAVWFTLRFAFAADQHPEIACHICRRAGFEYPHGGQHAVLTPALRPARRP